MVKTEEFNNLIFKRCESIALKSTKYRELERECYKLLKEGKIDAAIEQFQRLLEHTEVLCYKKGIKDGLSLLTM